MTNSITALITELKTYPLGNSDNSCRRNYSKARQLIEKSELNETDRNGALKVLRANCDSNGGYHYNNDGVIELVKHLEAMSAETEQASEEINVPAFNLRNLTALVSDGQIFTVEFIKRTTGDLRKLNCRIGVNKHLKGGKVAYNATEKQLLTVFDMTANGYRSIPLEGIQRVSVGGQVFSFNQEVAA